MVCLVEFQHCKECLLRHFDRADLFHAFLTLLLLFEELAFTRDVATVALRCHVLTHSLDGLTSDNLRTDSCLDSDVKLLTWNQFLEFLTHSSTEAYRVVEVGEGRKSIDAFAVEKDIELDEL